MNFGRRRTLFVLFLLLVVCSCASPEKSKKKPVSFQKSHDFDINQSMQPQMQKVRQCYLDAVAKNKKLKGPLSFTWEIHEDGLVQNIKKMKEPKSLNNKTFEKCLSNIIARTDFPAPPQNAVYHVQYHFVFDSDFRKSGLIIKEM